ncbi:hypothetical protein CPSG_04640 [Coccidioides posadasii str. Silveira]|uniref:Uncharacterized protein n=1 Tax=Coccidioides posadasii (strain RMSCC 757 / Silveira) TaxID=443226 RepID=E9D399_COCPS|nr:hypothetical protein CPSG_04640 [Coccidioides posadasii str. Silveira]
MTSERRKVRRKSQPLIMTVMETSQIWSRFFFSFCRCKATSLEKEEEHGGNAVRHLTTSGPKIMMSTPYKCDFSRHHIDLQTANVSDHQRIPQDKSNRNRVSDTNQGQEHIRGGLRRAEGSGSFPCLGRTKRLFAANQFPTAELQAPARQPWGMTSFAQVDIAISRS